MERELLLYMFFFLPEFYVAHSSMLYYDDQTYKKVEIFFCLTVTLTDAKGTFLVQGLLGNINGARAVGACLHCGNLPQRAIYSNLYGA